MALCRKMAHVGSIFGLMLVCLLVMATSAAASPMIPGVPDCKDAPMAQLPGDGLTGFLDGKPNPLPPQGDPFAKNPTISVYEQYGYAGLTWHTYDLGCGGDLRDVNASSDTMIGNATLAFATWGVAGVNGLHNKIAHPAEYMAPLDDVVGAVSTRIKDAIWSPWGGVALLGVVVLLLWYSSAGRLPAVTKALAGLLDRLRRGTFLDRLVRRSQQTEASPLFSMAVGEGPGRGEDGLAGITEHEGI